MFAKLVDYLDLNNMPESDRAVQEFTTKYIQSTSIPELNNDKLRERLWEGLFRYLKDPAASSANKILYITALKILIRDKTDLKSLVTSERVQILMKSAHLVKKHDDFPNDSSTNIIIESVKCLYNIILNYNPAAEMIIDCGITEPLAKRIVLSDSMDFEVRLFDLKLLFLFTAFCKSSRSDFLSKLGGIQFFYKLLDKQFKLMKKSKPSADLKSQTHQLLSDELKVLFNLLLDLHNIPSGTLYKQEEMMDLVAVVREYFLLDLDESGDVLKIDVINLLACIPVDNLVGMVIHFSESYNSEESAMAAGLLAITKVMDYLEEVLTNFGDGKNSDPTSRELLPTVLVVLLHLAQSASVIRKHIRHRILPKLTEAEVFTRPEEGTTLRNKLCRLLTSPISHITDATADLLFVLCKESVGRMVKYTGYGNAAGLFARRGLMSRPLEYSSDSEGSDTEEYNKHKEYINPIVGCRTPPHPNPLEGITEEQKEVLAMELVNRLDEMMKDKIFQPCVIGPNGHPQPIEHVQQLQNSSQFVESDNDSSEN